MHDYVAMIDCQACLRAIVVLMKGILTSKGHKMPKGHRVAKRKPARVDIVRNEIVVVPAAQYKRLTGPDSAKEVPSALRELVLQSRSSNAAR